MVITMASYALQTPPRVAQAKPPGPKVGENNGQLKMGKGTPGFWF